MQQRSCFQDAGQMSSLKVMPCLFFFMGHFINLSDELAFSRDTLVFTVTSNFLIKSGDGGKKSGNSLRYSFPNSMGCKCVCCVLVVWGNFLSCLFSLPKAAVILTDRKWNFA